VADRDPQPDVAMDDPDLDEALDEPDEHGPKFRAPHLEEGDGP
jgi:hypothetical protein